MLALTLFIIFIAVVGFSVYNYDRIQKGKAKYDLKPGDVYKFVLLDENPFNEYEVYATIKEVKKNYKGIPWVSYERSDRLNFLYELTIEEFIKYFEPYEEYNKDK